MMRLALAFLAVLALLTSPATAMAAQATCGHGGATAMSGMDVPAHSGMDQVSGAKSSGDPCCDPAHHQGKKTDGGCAQACAAACVAMTALPASLVGVSHACTRAQLTPARLASVKRFEPSGPRRPPKSIA